MKNRFILLMAISLCTGLFASSALADSSIKRISGADRFKTAEAISEQYNQGKAQNVILSTGNGFADALSASVLAHQKDAPILLTNSSVSTSQEAFGYITQHLNPTGTVYLIGGMGAISSEFEAKLKSLGFNHLVRIAGTDRYDTSYQLARALNDGSVSTVVISSGEEYSGALSIASFAANKGWPILLTRKDELPQETKDYLSEKKPSEVYITGGTGVISDDVLTEIKGLVPNANITRFAGQDRFDTNTLIAQTFTQNPTMIYLATGYDFADALAGSTLAAKNGVPIIFIDPSRPTLPKPVASYFAKLYAENMRPDLVAFGGSGVVTDEVMKASRDLISGIKEEDSIYSIEDLTVSLVLNQAYSLPATVQAKLYNGDTIDVPVKWNPTSVNTSKSGTTVYAGLIENYEGTVKLTLNIVSTPLH